MDRRNNLKINNLNADIKNKQKLNSENQRPYSYAKDTTTRVNTKAGRQKSGDLGQRLETQFKHEPFRNENSSYVELKPTSKDFYVDVLTESIKSTNTYLSISADDEPPIITPQACPPRPKWRDPNTIALEESSRSNPTYLTVIPDASPTVRKIKAPRYRCILLVTFGILIVIGATAGVVCFFVCREDPCKSDPCGEYELPDHAVLANDFNCNNMTLELRCKGGFHFKNGSDRFLRCVNEKWIKGSECVYQPVYLTASVNQFKRGSSPTVDVDIQNISGWASIEIRKECNMSSTVYSRIYKNYTTKDMFRHVKLTNPILSNDSAVFQIRFNATSCYDACQNGSRAKYLAAVDLGQDVVDGFVNIDFVDDAQMPKLTYESPEIGSGQATILICEGDVGIPANPMTLLKNGSPLLITSTPSEFYSETCENLHTIRYTDVSDGDEYICRISLNNSIVLSSNNITVDAKESVNLTTSVNPFKRGSSPAVYVDIQNISDWTSIEIRKECSMFSTVYSRVYSNYTVEDMFGHVQLTGPILSNESAVFRLKFNGTTCYDACQNGSRAKYLAAVDLGEDIVNGFVDIDFADDAQMPQLTFVTTEVCSNSATIGQLTTLICEGDVGIPASPMSLLKNGFSLQDTSTPSEFNDETCDNLHTIRYTFLVSETDSGDEYVCKTLLNNSTVLTSNNYTVHVGEEVLYFTPESRHAEIGKQHRLSCVQTLTSNFSSMQLFRGASKTPLCSTYMNGSGSCNDPNYSVDGQFEGNGTSMNVDFLKVRCIDDSEYVCLAKGECDYRAVLKLNATKPMRKPFIHLPRTFVENQSTLWEDVLNCTADVGHPSTGMSLRLHIKLKNTQTYQPFNVALPATGNCETNATIELRRLRFNDSFNESRLRCAIMETDNVLLADETEVILLKNTCLPEEQDSYYPHPVDCKKYIRCVNGFLYVYPCAQGACTKQDPPFNGINICTGDCSACQTTN